MLTQKEIQRLIKPLLTQKGKTYKKFKSIKARVANEEEHIVTITNDGIETTNQAFPGDFIVQNQTKAGEQYVVTPEKFKKRYVLKTKLKNGLAEYEPIGRIQAIPITKQLLKRLGEKAEFYFIASWGEKMVAKENDFLVSGIGSESVYRIAREEFYETYKLEK